MEVKTLQCNLNRSWGAYDLLKQYVSEENIGLVIISEPPRGIGMSNTWLASDDGLAAILWRAGCTQGYICRLRYRKRNIIATDFGDMAIISCYISPNVRIASFYKFLQDLESCVSNFSGRGVIIAGDFNAALWGASRTDRRGELLERLVASYDLTILSKKNQFTCIRPQGSSIVDLILITSRLINRAVRWRVCDDAETLSDHRYIRFSLFGGNPIGAQGRGSSNSNKRWLFKKMDKELYVNSLDFITDSVVSEDIKQCPELYAGWLSGVVRSACDVSTPKSR